VPPSIDVGILTIREDEFRALLAVFPMDEGAYRGRREYSLRLANAGNGARYRIALLRAIEQGNGEAQDAARDLIEDLRPALLLVVGIAGGLPSEDFTLGDVVLATRVNDYCVAARREGAEPSYNLGGGPIEKKIAAGITNLPARGKDLGDWTRDLPPRPPAEWSRRGALYGPVPWRRDLRRKLEAHFVNAGVRPPIFTTGVIASSDTLVKDPNLLFPWIQTARHLLAVEMESAGVFRAARDRCPMLAIRGISDIVGLKRDDAWTKYACASAAAFTRAYLRTQPVSPAALNNAVANDMGDRASAPLPALGGTPSPLPESLYSNVLPLQGYPSTVYVAPSTCRSIGEAWARLLDGQSSGVPNAWALHEKMLYSLVDPSTCQLSLLADVGAAEAHDSSLWATSEDPDRRRLFVWLLNGALRDDLGTAGVWYFRQDDLFAFAGKPDEPDRKHAYRSLHKNSAITVVFHHEWVRKDGRKFPYLRHNAFRGRFRRVGGAWHLEVTPTYRFTSDGKRKYLFHEDQLRGIKRLERNRAVLSQVLLWTDVLCPPLSLFSGRARLLRFGPGLVFGATRSVPDEQWSQPGDEGLDEGQDAALPLLARAAKDAAEP
jgi:nucleoside phosphorylase